MVTRYARVAGWWVAWRVRRWSARAGARRARAVVAWARGEGPYPVPVSAVAALACRPADGTAPVLGHAWAYEPEVLPSWRPVVLGAPSALACARCGTRRTLGLLLDFRRAVAALKTFRDDPSLPPLAPPSDAPRFGL